MKIQLQPSTLRILLPALAIIFALPLPAFAASIALATSPMATSSVSTVKPNVLFILDDSGSMNRDYMPDNAGNFNYYGLRSNQCSQVYYDPLTTYLPPIKADGSVYPDASFTAAWTNGYTTSSGTVDLSTSFRANGDSSGSAAYYYTYSGTQTTSLQKDYNDSSSTFYRECDSNDGSAPGNAVFSKVVVSASSGPSGTDELTNFANWYSYYRTRLLMMKTATGHAFSGLNNSYRVGLMKIGNSSSPVEPLDTFESTHRAAWYSALYNTATSGSTPLREALANAGYYYAGKLSGADPVQYSCQQNFTILSTDGYWNGNDGFKLDGTAVGNQDGTVGRPMFDGAQAATTTTTTYTRNDYSEKKGGIGSDPDCSGANRRIISQPEKRTCSTSGGGSPVCTSWSNSGPQVYVSPFTSDPATCAHKNSVSTPNPNPSVPVETGSVVSAGSSGGTSDTLADVAMYYYQTDLRTSSLGNCGMTTTANPEGLCKNNVFISDNDINTQQHMTTFTLGLGASGRMNYSSSYLSDTSGDYYAVKLGEVANSAAIPPICSWQADGTVCGWPEPTSNSIETIDDLWHAAVNGRGAYFSATNPETLSQGLSSALAGINARKGSAAAAATSTLNPVAGNNYAFVASYTTVSWKGNLESRGINTDTGVVNENASWCVENLVAGTCVSPSTIITDTSGDTTSYYCSTPNSVTCNGGFLDGSNCNIPLATSCTGTMTSKVGDLNDTRTILTHDGSGSLIDFAAAYVASNPGYFDAAHIGTLTQWSTLDPTQQAAATGLNLMRYLRGQYGFEDRSSNLPANRLYRYREATLGDTLESQPAFIGAPVFSYPYPGYSAYLTAQSSRAGSVYIGANDGMMHAFAADTGVERWAYVPSMVIPNMWKLADINYGGAHQNFVNGSPITSDVCVSACGGGSAVWKTILVGGLNGGGRGYYALDITNPATPALLWEFTPSTGIGTVQDDDLGYSFGQAVISRKADGTWVVLVTSGYNNTSPGDGKGYLYVLDAATGAIISKISTGVGNTTTPSGLAKIAAWNDEPKGNKAGSVYGGDLQGNLWRFDINSSASAAIGTGEVMKLASLFSDAAGTSPQAITTSPVLGEVARKRIIFVGTGQYLETSDLSTTQVQSMYGIKDDNATVTLVNPRTTLINQTITDNPDGTATRLSSSNAVNFLDDRGWFVDFPDSGERVNIDSQLIEGTLLVPTIVPSNSVCSPGGYGWLNFLNYKTGGAVNYPSNVITSVRYDSTIVGINVIYVQGKPKVGVVTSTDPTPKINESVGFAATATGFSGKRAIWRELIP